MSANSSLISDRAYRPDIDGLRAIAILSVVHFHSGLVRLAGGFTGVDIFFVISGYLIGGHIWTEMRAGVFSYRRFYQRRAKRILPAFYAVLVFMLGAGLLLLSPHDLELLGRSAVAATLSVSNILFWGTANYFAGSSERNPLLMTWSLGVEEQFYLIVPLLMAMVARIRGRLASPVIAAMSLASFAFACVMASRHPMAGFYLLPSRAWELGGGVALALYETSLRLKPTSRLWIEIGGITALGLMIAAIVAHGTEPAAFPWIVLPAVVGAALSIAVPGSWVNRRLLSAPPLRFVGQISYSWYLWHWPLLSLMHVLYGGAIPVARAAETVALSFALAVASYFLIEQPFRRSTQPATRVLTRYAVASAILFALSAAVWSSHGIPQRFPALAQMESPDEALRSDPCLSGLDRDAPNLSPTCYDTAGTKPLVALWGDSHSAAMAPGLRSLAMRQGYGFAQLGKASCPPLIGVTHFIPRIPLLGKGCQHFNDTVLSKLRADSRIHVVILSAAWAAPFYRDWESGWLTADLAHAQYSPTAQATNALFVASLRTTIQSLQESGKQVIVLEDAPEFTIDPLWRVESERILVRQKLLQLLTIPSVGDPGTAVIDSSPNIDLARSLVEETVEQSSGVQLIDPKAALCADPGRCSYRDGNSLLYVDSNHVSPAGALLAVEELKLPAADKVQRPRTETTSQAANSHVAH